MNTLGHLLVVASALAGCGPTADGVLDAGTHDGFVASVAPVFRAPLGNGTTVDLSVEPCLEIDVLIDDADSAWVDVAQEAPVIVGATLGQASGHEAIWSWCPTAGQVASEDGWALRLSAADGLHAPVVKDYLIVRRSEVEQPEGGDDPPPACADDDAEPDDNATFARRVDLDLPHVSTTNAICAGDDDWYRIYLYGGERVHVALGFTQTSPAEDLDLHLVWGSVDLTPCSEAAPESCDGANGQGTTSNENMIYTVGLSGWYYVLVHGWDGSENDYDICIGLSAAECPPLP